ncbi:MAG TPA: site-2 protease family protein [Terriglobales bacterium]|nr:site-2 protease family protein [Terriglobales bacterium]
MSEPTPAVPRSTVDYGPMPVLLAPPRRQRYWLHAVLLLATIFTTLVVGSHFQYNFEQQRPALADEDDSQFPLFPIDAIWHHPARLLLGIPFSASLMLILLAHEMGHYLLCVRYDVDATLPFFIPFPSLIGTMGAFIRIRSPIHSRRALFDIGIAGPIAGFVVACVVLAIALGLSRAAPTTAPQSTDALLIHYPLIFDLAHRGLASLGMLNEIAALPFRNLLLHPMAFAAWGGMFATSLNLLPGGQLDGGHILFSIAPRAHRTVSRLTILCLIPMAVYLWYGWLIWAILLELSSFRHPQVSEFPKVSGKRLALAAFALVMLVVTIIPKPIVLMEDGHDRTSLKSLVRSWRHK